MNISINNIKLEIDARPENVSHARVMVASFIAGLDPSVGEISDIKTAVSEAVTNAIIHGYGKDDEMDVLPQCNTAKDTGKNADNHTGVVTISAASYVSDNERKLVIKITDQGVGIANIESARAPLFTTKPEMERSGLGFTVMESFMDSVDISSNLGTGTTVTLTKILTQGN